MAIIYTYPPVTDPDGTELIVVSETKNKNSTRLITLAGICEFCDESTGCDHSFKYIQTSSLTPAEAVGCDQTLELTSSDATVTITNVGNTIDFVSAGGGGGCPTTYVIKPVYCEDTVCYIGELQSEWIYTCDETLGALAPGYINNLTITGIPVESESGCWYIEQATFSATATTCEVCCGGATPTYSYEKCDEAGVFVTVDVDPGHSIGKTFTYCCDGYTELQTVKCWEYVGDIGAPVGGTFDPCIEFGDPGDDCDCCINRCNYTWTACTPNPGGFPATLTFDVGMDKASICVCNGPIPHDIVVEDAVSLETWCYTDPYSTCDDADGAGYNIIGAPAAPCDDPDYCPADVPTYTWQKCDGGPYVTVPVDPGIPVGQIDRYCCDGDPLTHHCYEYLGSIGEPVAGIFPCPGPFESYPSDCECCLNPCTYKYTACPGYDPLIFQPEIWVGYDFEEGSCDCQTPDPDIYIQIDDNTWCYSDPVKECQPGSTIPAGIAVCGDMDYCPDPVYVKYNYCADPGDGLWASSVGTPGIESTLVGSTVSHGGTCYEIIENPSTINPLHEIPGFIEYDPSVECDCCEAGPNRIYTACAEGPSIIIDPSLWASLNPLSIDSFIKIEWGVNPGVWECYVFSECTNNPATAGISDVDTSINCDDPSCITFVKLTDCTGTYTETVKASDLTPDPLTLSPGDVINVTAGTLAAIGTTTCWTIVSLNAPAPATQIGNTDWEGPIAGGGTPTTTPCLCCEMDLRLYDVCDLGAPCQATVAPQLVIDMAAVPGPTPMYIIATDVASGNDCCYHLALEAPPCQDYTGIYVSTITGCEDEVCAELAPVWELESCAGTTKYVSELDFVANPSGLNVGDIINITVGTLSGECWEIISKDSAGVIELGTQTWNGPIAAGFYDACTCCEMDLRTYNICDLGAGTCAAGAAVSIVIDMTGVSPIPSNIIAKEILTNQDCCYWLDPVLPDCVEITGTYSDPNLIDNCDDPDCLLL